MLKIMAFGGHISARPMKRAGRRFFKKQKNDILIPGFLTDV